MGHNSINIKSRAMPLAVNLRFVSGDVCTKFHLNIFKRYRVMAMVNFCTNFCFKKGITQSLFMPLAFHVCFVSENMCTKFDLNILNVLHDYEKDDDDTKAIIFFHFLFFLKNRLAKKY